MRTSKPGVALPIEPGGSKQFGVAADHEIAFGLAEHSWASMPKVRAHPASNSPPSDSPPVKMLRNLTLEV